MLRRIKAGFIAIFICRGKHSPTLLEDEETVYCERCGKVLGWLYRGKYITKPSKPIVRKGIVTAASVYEARKELEKTQEERIREEWLPKPSPKLKRRMRHPGLPKPKSAAIHQDIGKFMAGKSKHHHKTYRRTTKARIQPEED